MKKKRIVRILVFVLLFTIGGIGFYANDYYRASEAAITAFAEGEALTQNVTVFRPAEPVAAENIAGLIFYPGGKVAVEAYAPLMEQLANEGIPCVLLEMPLNLAVLNSKAAKDIADLVPEVDRWYLGGHSLGGAMAAGYAADHADDFEGVVLLAAYSTKSLKDRGLDCVSIFGTQDKILNREKYEEYRGNLPKGTVEIIIEGGNHAQFGDYGPQTGDGTATISREEQLKQTAQTIKELVRN